LLCMQLLHQQPPVCLQVLPLLVQLLQNVHHTAACNSQLCDFGSLWQLADLKASDHSHMHKAWMVNTCCCRLTVPTDVGLACCSLGSASCCTLLSQLIEPDLA
jgi:hypothetical protein